MMSLFPSRAVAFEILGFSIHWYGLLYLLSFLLGLWIVPHLQSYRNLDLSKEEWTRIASWAVVGVIVGGRLGYVLFYAPGVFLANPLEVFAVWKGGMASHGGFIGVTAALWFAIRRRDIPPLALADIIVVPVALGLALGRMGNLINLELYGTVTSLPWGMEFPGAEGFRHPTQIYAFLKNLLIAGACFWHLRSARTAFVGQTCALFLMLYGMLRFVVEIFRDQPYGYAEVLGLSLSRGQLLSLPILGVGVVLFLYTRRQSLR